MRQFLAITLPTAVRERVGRLQTELREACPGWRWVRPEAMHLTVRFLGEVPDERDGALRALWREAARSRNPFRVRLRGLGRFPPGGRPRVLWIGVVEDPPAGRLPRLVEAVEEYARQAGFPPEERAFRSHVTIARAARGARPAEPPPRGYDDAEPVQVSELVLFHSELGSGGARYRELEAYPLLGAETGAKAP